MNTIVILVVIVIALAAMWLYAQNRKQAALPEAAPTVAMAMLPQVASAPAY